VETAVFRQMFGSELEVVESVVKKHSAKASDIRSGEDG
jgi:hypothetical protein